MAERGLELMVARGAHRKTFGKRLLRHVSCGWKIEEGGAREGGARGGRD